MARFRLAQPAQNDLANILATSAEHWGTEGRRRYARLLAAGMRESQQILKARSLRLETNSRPDFVFMFCTIGAIQPGLIEIVRVLHERMEPSSPLRRPAVKVRKPSETCPIT
jgi:plasmid stabilization system protein ParE